jgi:hypothetical protein
VSPSVKAEKEDTCCLSSQQWGAGRGPTVAELGALLRVQSLESAMLEAAQFTSCLTGGSIESGGGDGGTVSLQC